VTGSIARSQTHAQQASGVTLENQHGMVHVLVVGAVEETELLLAVRRIVGGIDIQQNLAALADLPATETNELIQERIVQMHQAAGGRCVFPAAEGWLRAEWLSQFLIGDDLQGGIMAQAVGIVGVLVAGDDLVDALPQQRQRVVLDALLPARVI